VARSANISLEQLQIPIVATSAFAGKRYGKWAEVVSRLSEYLPEAHFIFITGDNKEQFLQEQYPLISQDNTLQQKVHMAEGNLIELASYYANANIPVAASDDTGPGWHLMAAVPGDYSIVTPCGPFTFYAPDYWQSNAIRQIPIPPDYALSVFRRGRGELNNSTKDRSINAHNPELIAYMMYQAQYKMRRS
jgi:hypothetical protein